MAAMKTNILDIPLDILEIVFLYLDPRSFLRFCSLSKQFWQDQSRNSTFWRVTTAKVFRIPISPLLQAEGDRWYWLYKKLRTQTQAFAWGQGGHYGLGMPFTRQGQQPNQRLRGIPARLTNPLGRQPNPAGRVEEGRLAADCSNHAWPAKMCVPEEVGIIADLQCGGWSTTLLSSRGDLYSVGALDQDVGLQVRDMRRLNYRSTLPIRRFSAGRKHVLGLDEEGKVWSWDRIDQPAWLIYDISPLKASIVVAGWGVSSAFTRRGIIYWHVPNGIAQEFTNEARTPVGSGDLDELQTEVPLHAGERMFVKTTVIRGTSFRSNQQEADDDGSSIGEVLAYVVLEAYIVFITGLAKVFACRIVGENEDDAKELPFHLPGYSASERQFKDIQGSFRKFSVFTSTGEVLSGDQKYLDQLYDLRDMAGQDHDGITVPLKQEANEIERPADIPALQNTGVISMAYGDYHFHALHSEGQITSYGREPECCGALGLGADEAGAHFRGLKRDRGNIWNRDARLLPIANRFGREIWFSKSQEARLKKLEDLVGRRADSPDGNGTLAGVLKQKDKQAAYSQWVEQEGRAWEEGVEDDDDDGLRSYFAISVAAAGWHSAALVLENSGKVERVREKWVNSEGRYVWEDAPFPRIGLPNGFEFPGSGKLHEWKGGMPSMEELALPELDTSTSAQTPPAGGGGGGGADGG